MDDIIVEDQTPWYAIKLFTLQLKNVRGYFDTKELEYFVPMQYVDIEDKETHRIKHVLRPVVSNLIFVKKTIPEKDMRKIVFESPYKMSVIKKSRESI